MVASRYRLQGVWIAIVYVAIIALVLYPALHEGFTTRIILWNCVPPTLGLILITTALSKSRPRLVASAAFALLTAAVAAFFSAAWFFTSLDTDPHSMTTVLVFVFAPVLSLAIATIGAGLAWFVVRT